MNKILIILALAMVLVMPIVAATDTGTSVGINVNTQKFAPRIWMCDSRTVTDDKTQNGENGLSLTERKHNYAFEGESIHWNVLVMDKNKIEEISDVVGTIGPTQGAGNDAEVECKRTDGPSEIPSKCNARIDEERLTKFDEKTMAYYDCHFTVETANSMHGEYFITVEAKDSTGLSATMSENEFWFLNPTIGLSVSGDLEFNEVMPGTDAYSQTILVGNDAESGSGVILDMFISGTDFYDPAASGAACPSTNQLALTNFRYYATNGAFASQGKLETDAEGYTAIPYSTDISGAKRIIRWSSTPRGASPSSSVVEQDWNNGNALSPGSEMALTFKLSMPEPCVGDFSDGNIYFWGEAI
ncbi:Uncharacterised protein [uncultured archaeon]|nr:Uncharacterised protein [uncultured archaeon]